LDTQSMLSTSIAMHKLLLVCSSLMCIDFSHHLLDSTKHELVSTESIDGSQTLPSNTLQRSIQAPFFQT